MTSPSEQLAAAMAKAPKRSKYGARRTTVDGITFDSAREARRWGALVLLERAGEISELRRQCRFLLEVNGVLVSTYVCDFSFRRKGAERLTVEDSKGVLTKDCKIKLALMKAVHGIDVVLT